VVVAMVVEVAEAVMVAVEVTATMNVAAAVVEVTVVVEAAAMVEEVVVTETAAAAAVVLVVETGETVTTLLTECVHAQVVKASCCSRMGIVFTSHVCLPCPREEKEMWEEICLGWVWKDAYR